MPFCGVYDVSSIVHNPGTVQATPINLPQYIFSSQELHDLTCSPNITEAIK
jgi:hypothetical protein